MCTEVVFKQIFVANNIKSRLMKFLLVINILIFISNFGFSQLDYVDSFIEVNRENSLELFGTDDLYITNNGSFIYAFSDTSILRYQRDTISGKAISVKLFNDRLYGINSTSFCHRAYAVTSDERFLYLAGNCYNAISIFQLDPTTGDCFFIDTVVNNHEGVVGLDMPYKLSISDDNKFLYVAALGDNQITIFSINQEDGTLSYQGANKHSALENINLVKTTPDNEFLYATSSTDSALIIFRRDVENGLLTFQKKINRNIDNQYFFKGISDIDFDLDGHVFITAKSDSALNVFKIHASYDSLILKKSFREGSDNVYGLDQPIAVKVSPNQKFVYVLSVNLFVSRALAEFELINNEIQFNGAEHGELNYPSSIKISQDSRFLYIAEMTSSICKIFKPLFLLDLGEDKELCTGETITLHTDEKYASYKWSNQSNDTAIVVSSTDTISLEVIDKYGKTGIDTIIITFLESPQIDLGADTTLNSDDTIVLTVDTGYETYLWNAGSTSNSISIFADSIVNDTIISVIVTSENGCSAQDSILITIYNPTFISDINETDLIIYPNPFYNTITITGNDLVKYNSIELIDLSGKKVYYKNKSMLSSNELLTIYGIKKGVYILRIYNEKECLIKKVIKLQSL